MVDMTEKIQLPVCMACEAEVSHVDGDCHMCDTCLEASDAAFMEDVKRRDTDSVCPLRAWYDTSDELI